MSTISGPEDPRGQRLCLLSWFLFRSLQGAPGFPVTCADPPGGQHHVQQLADGKILEQRDHASQLFIKLEH